MFPRHRLPTRMRDESKVPLVIVACGSFSPPTYLHLCVRRVLWRWLLWLTRCAQAHL